MHLDFADDIVLRSDTVQQAQQPILNVKIWKSNLDEYLKVMLFRATTDITLLYGSQTWALTSAEERELNGTFTRMPRKVKNINW